MATTRDSQGRTMRNAFANRGYHRFGIHRADATAFHSLQE